MIKAHIWCCNPTMLFLLFICSKPATKSLTEAGAAIHVKPGARVTFAIVGAPGVNASVLATSIVDLAFINICMEGGIQVKY